MVLKPNMVVPGKKSAKRASVEEVAEKTLRVLKACVPAAVPGIAFLSGGQSDEEATAHLDAMNKMGPLPWRVTFSYGRALQAAPQKTWSGKSENVAAAQRAFGHRAMMNGLATLGQWKADLERKTACGVDANAVPASRQRSRRRSGTRRGSTPRFIWSRRNSTIPASFARDLDAVLDSRRYRGRAAAA